MGTFHVTLLLLRLSQDKGLLPVALGDKKQAPGVRRGPLGTLASLGQGPQLLSPQDPDWGGWGVKAKGGVICSDTPPRPTCSHSSSSKGPEKAKAPKLFQETPTSTEGHQAWEHCQIPSKDKVHFRRTCLQNCWVSNLRTWREFKVSGTPTGTVTVGE